MSALSQFSLSYAKLVLSPDVLQFAHVTACCRTKLLWMRRVCSLKNWSTLYSQFAIGTTTFLLTSPAEPGSGHYTSHTTVILIVINILTIKQHLISCSTLLMFLFVCIYQVLLNVLQDQRAIVHLLPNENNEPQLYLQTN